MGMGGRAGGGDGWQDGRQDGRWGWVAGQAIACRFEFMALQQQLATRFFPGGAMQGARFQFRLQVWVLVEGEREPAADFSRCNRER